MKPQDILIDTALERVRGWSGKISDHIMAQVVEQLEWIKSSYSDEIPKENLPKFNLGSINARVFDEIDPTLSALIRRILTKIGHYEKH